MIKIDALMFLIIIEFLLIFFGLTVFLFLKYRKQTMKVNIPGEEVQKLKDVIENKEKKIVELSGWKHKFTDSEKRFELTGIINAKLIEFFMGLIPDAEKSEELKKIIADFDYSDKELDTLKDENEKLNQKIKDFEQEIKGISGILQGSLSNKGSDTVSAEGDEFAEKVRKLEEELKNKEEECIKLKDTYADLEKEYNILYNKHAS